MLPVHDLRKEQEHVKHMHVGMWASCFSLSASVGEINTEQGMAPFSSASTHH